MADRGILFSAPMVMALLAGRKTQTRRLSAVRKGLTLGELIDGGKKTLAGHVTAYMATREMLAEPINKVGDRLWCRETWSTNVAFDGIRPRDLKNGSMIYTRADDLWHNSFDWIGAPYGKKRPGIFMPRWASRITLTVTDVRVEQLQSISEVDAIAEGIEPVLRTDSGQFYRNYLNPPCPMMAYGSYRSLWEVLHDKPGERWDDNPWVVATSFTVRAGNIDAAES